MDAIREFMTTTNEPILLFYAAPGVQVPPRLVS